MNTILVTGSPGFIGANLVIKLLKTLTSGLIVSLDNLNDYYDPDLKLYRLALIEETAKEAAANAAKTSKADSLVRHVFIKGDIADKELVDNVFRQYKFDTVVNLAAQAGVRYSITNPDAYINSNIIGFYNILEACRHSYSYDNNANNADNRAKNGSNNCADNAFNASAGVQHLIYASSSSVYGGNKKIPFSTDDKVDHPVSLYAATKKSNELMAHAYSKLYNIPSTGLRFFTVYGPAGRPDMFYFSATNRLAAGEKIQLFNYGDMKRDFTYVDDIVEGIIRVMNRPPARRSGPDGLPIPPYALYNIGGGQPENLLTFITVLQEELVRAKILPSGYDFERSRELVGMQAGDVPVTFADTEALERDFGFKPKVDIRTGLRKFCEWYEEYYMQNIMEKN